MLSRLPGGVNDKAAFEWGHGLQAGGHYPMIFRYSCGMG